MRKALEEFGKVLITVTLVLSLAGCALNRPVMPKMDLPMEPVKPKIQSSVIVQNSVPYIGYTVPDALKLYEYLLTTDSYAEKLRFRINEMNRWNR